MSKRESQNLRTSFFEVKSVSEVETLRQAVMDMAQCQNMLLILLHENYENFKNGHIENYQSLLLNAAIIRCLASGASGGKNSEKLDLLREKFGQHDIFQQLEKHCKENLKDKNLYKMVIKLKAAYDGYFTKQKKGDTTARPPRAKKLSRITSFALPVDQYAYSLKRKNRIRINLNEKMQDFRLNHDALQKAVGDFKNIQSLEVVYRHGKIFFAVIYHKDQVILGERQPKYAGLDLGIVNLASVFIEDTDTTSLVVEGDLASEFNEKNNRNIARLQSKSDGLRNRFDDELKKLKDKNKETPIPDIIEENVELQILLHDCKSARKKVEHEFAKRHNYFQDKFHKCSTRILEYLCQAGVTTLCVSRNLGKAKQRKGLSKNFNKRFYRIPILKLIDQLSLKASDYGICIEEIDEAYTSKTSVLSGDIHTLQKSRTTQGTLPASVKATALNGERVDRDHYRDNSGDVFYADLNGAANHIVVGRQSSPMTWLRQCLWKLQTPLLFKFDSLFLDASLKTGVKPRDSLRASCAARLLGGLSEDKFALV